MWGAADLIVGGAADLIVGGAADVQCVYFNAIMLGHSTYT